MSILFKKTEQLLHFIYLGMVIQGIRTNQFASAGLAVPRLGNVRLRLHFLRRGTYWGTPATITLQADNPKYPNLTLPAESIRAIWKVTQILNQPVH